MRGRPLLRGGGPCGGVESPLRQGEPSAEVGISGKRGGEPIAKPFNLPFGGKVEVVKADSGP